MTRFNLAGLVLVSAVAVGCGGEEPAVPAPQSQSQASSYTNQPVTVTGCLRAGDAENTFVLTTAQTVDGTPAATYHLTGNTVTNLRDHVGKRLEVNGVVSDQSQIATRQPPQPADNATGTAGSSGTPTVQTGTQLSVRSLEVASVKAAGGECQQ